MTTRAALPGRLLPPRQSRRGWRYVPSACWSAALGRRVPIRGRAPTARLAFALLLPLVWLTGCARQSAVPFRVDNARAHLDRLTNAGPRPTGSAANTAARAYLVDQLRLYGFDVRTQTVDASRPEYGRTMRVNQHHCDEAGLAPTTPRPGRALRLGGHRTGAMDDDGSGGRRPGGGAAARRRPGLRTHADRALTDARNSAMGAVGAMGDAELRPPVKGSPNWGRRGSTGTGHPLRIRPGNETLIRTWASAAQRRTAPSMPGNLPGAANGTPDFTILKAAGIPGLNLAPVGNSHAYHTSRDTVDRVSSDTLLHMGETAVTTLRAMDALDRQASDRDVRFASIGQRTVIVLADWQGRVRSSPSPRLSLDPVVRGPPPPNAIRFIAHALWGVCPFAAVAHGRRAWLVPFEAVHHPCTRHRCGPVR